MTSAWTGTVATALLLGLAACSSGGEATGVTAQAPTSDGPTATGPITPSSATAGPTPAGTPANTENGGPLDVDTSTLHLRVGDTRLTATLVDNSSVDALVDLLADGPLTIGMRDYEGMEKVGPLGTALPRNDERITTQPGDLILYQGNALVIYYAPNTWDFTRLGRIDATTTEELRKILGPGEVSVTLSLE